MDKSKEEKNRIEKIGLCIGALLVILYFIGFLFLPKQPSIDEEYTLSSHALKLRTIPFYMYMALPVLFFLTLLEGSHYKTISRCLTAKIVFVVCFWCVELIAQNFLVCAVLQTLSAVFYFILANLIKKESLIED